jgi:hypothetical protein
VSLLRSCSRLVLRGAALLASMLASQGCLREKQGLPYDQLAISGTRADGSAVPGLPDCITLPLLLGSIVEKRYPLEGELEISVFATRDAVELSFAGAPSQAALDRRISAEQLRATFDQELLVDSSSGARFDVHLSSKCPASSSQ